MTALLVVRGESFEVWCSEYPERNYFTARRCDNGDYVVLLCDAVRGFNELVRALELCVESSAFDKNKAVTQ